MGCFCAETLKPTLLYSNRRWIFALGRDRPLPSNFDNTITVTKVEKTGAFGGVSVNGAKGLKGTQAYTEAFAHELLKAYLGTNLDSHNHLEEQSPDSDDDTPEVPSNFWEDARLCPEERRKLKK